MKLMAARRSAVSKYLILPAVVAVLVVGLVPFLVLINYSVQTPYAEQNVFVAFNNFRKIVSEPRFIDALRRNIIFSATVLSIEIPLGLLLAFLLYEKSKVNAVISTFIIIPALVPPISIGLLWRLLIRTAGPLGQLAALMNLGYDPFKIPSHAYWTIVLMDMWHWTSLITIVTSAGLAGMDRTPVLSARTEGATRWQIFRHVELPAISFPLVFVSLIRLIDSLKIYDEVIILTGGGPGLTNEYISQYLKTIAIDQWIIGIGAAGSLIYNFIVLMLCYLLLIVMTRGRGLI